MHLRITLALAAGLLYAGSASAQSQSMKLANQYRWMTDYYSAKAESQRTGKPMMIVFRCDP